MSTKGIRKEYLHRPHTKINRFCYFELETAMKRYGKLSPRRNSVPALFTQLRLASLLSAYMKTLFYFHMFLLRIRNDSTVYMDWLTPRYWGFVERCQLGPIQLANKFLNEHRGNVVSILTSYSAGTGFDSRPGGSVF